MTDAQMLQYAATLIKEAAGLLNQAVPRASTAQWLQSAEVWRRQYERHPETSRWRPIDEQGNVSPDPAPETPDDPDEGETGPPEVILDDLGAARPDEETP